MVEQQERESSLSYEHVVEENQEQIVVKNIFLKQTVENPELNQYWYSAYTISVLVKVHFLKIAIICVYTSMPSKQTFHACSFVRNSI